MGKKKWRILRLRTLLTSISRHFITRIGIRPPGLTRWVGREILKGNPASGLIHHTDRDCRYASDDYQAALRDQEMAPSISGKGDCWDNAVAESFFATLEKELFGENKLKSRVNTRVEIANYIESYYNDVRRHSYIDYVSPLEYELMMS